MLVAALVSIPLLLLVMVLGFFSAGYYSWTRRVGDGSIFRRPEISRSPAGLAASSSVRRPQQLRRLLLNASHQDDPTIAIPEQPQHHSQESWIDDSTMIGSLSSSSSSSSSSVGLADLVPRRLLLSVPSFLFNFLPGASSSLFSFDCHTQFEVLQTIDHDTNAWTQGLTFDKQNSNILYESTGIYGESDVRKIDLSNGGYDVTSLVDSPSTIFGEGLAYYTDSATAARRLIHITWKSQVGYIMDADTLQTLETFTFTTSTNEGWGITYNPVGNEFIVTDGSKNLHFWDATTLSETNRIATSVSSGLNEIEWDESTSTILANVIPTNSIVRIDPTNGAITNTYNLADLYTCRSTTANVLNGIAINPTNGDIWVTGKNWPNMYRINLIA